MKIETPILKCLGHVPFWRGEQKCLDVLESIYKRAMEASRRSLYEEAEFTSSTESQFRAR